MTTTAYFSEVFISLDGEGPFTGVPTVYMRFGGCNLRCPGFNNPDNLPVLDFNPLDYKTIQSLPLITRGCDSNYSVDKKLFKHMWDKLTPEEALGNVRALLPSGLWKAIHNKGNPYILSITGGEPLLFQKFLCEFLPLANEDGCETILFETNSTLLLTDDFVDVLNNLDSKIIWSNSPKLKSSGESPEKTIVALSGIHQQRVHYSHPYYKFVVNGSQADISEVCWILDYYKSNGLEINPQDIYLMPAACTMEQQNEVAQTVAKQCIEYGFNFSYRLQNTLWNNGVGC